MRAYTCDRCSRPLPHHRYSLRIALALSPADPARSAGSEADLCLSCYQTFMRRLADWLADGRAAREPQSSRLATTTSLN